MARSTRLHHYAIQFAAGRWFSPGTMPRYSWNTVESGVEHYNPNTLSFMLFIQHVTLRSIIFLSSTNFELELKNCPIRIKYLFDTGFWLHVVVFVVFCCLFVFFCFFCGVRMQTLRWSFAYYLCSHLWKQLIRTVCIIYKVFSLDGFGARVRTSHCESRSQSCYSHH